MNKVYRGYKDLKVYQLAYKLALVDAFGEAGETEVWLDISLDSRYISEEKQNYFIARYEEVSKMLYSMLTQPEKFCS